MLRSGYETPAYSASQKDALARLKESLCVDSTISEAGLNPARARSLIVLIRQSLGDAASAISTILPSTGARTRSGAYAASDRRLQSLCARRTTQDSFVALT